MDMNGSTFEGTFQSTLPRRERPQLSRNFRDVAPISIHAPAKGATSEADEAVKLSHISIHAPAKGATRTVPHSGG